MATGLASWSVTAADNASSDSAVNWAEGQAPSTVNNSARAVMASAAKYRDDIEGSLTTGGTATAFTATTAQSFASLTALDGNQLALKFHLTSGPNATLAVDGLTAKALQTAVGSALPTSSIAANSIHRVTYDNANNAFLLHDRLVGGLAVSDLDINGASSAVSPSSNDAAIIYDTSSAANFKMILSDVLKVVNTLASVTSVASTDEALIYQIAGSVATKATVADVFKVIGTLATESAPASTDVFAVHDISASTTDKMTFSDAFKVINTLASVVAVQSTSEAVVYHPASTAAGKATIATLLSGLNSLASDAAPDSVNDFLLSYDSSDGSAKKVAPTNLGLAAAAVGASEVVISTQSVTNVGSVIFSAGLDGTYNSMKLVIANLKSSVDTVNVLLRAAVGGVYQSTATSYAWGTDVINAGGATFDSDNAASAISLNPNSFELGNAAGENLSATIEFGNPGASDFQMFNYRGRYSRADTGSAQGFTGIANLAGVSSINGISVFLNTGSVSGRFTLIGSKHTG